MDGFGPIQTDAQVEHARIEGSLSDLCAPVPIAMHSMGDHVYRYATLAKRSGDSIPIVPQRRLATGQRHLPGSSVGQLRHDFEALVERQFIVNSSTGTRTAV